jgi:ring-1,2-phenylacetyl-CoA epoxidase subunit PaaE
MGLFNIFKKKDGNESTVKGFFPVVVKQKERLTSNASKISFSIPEHLSDTFPYKPGQYIDVLVKINGKEERRSYSICSGPKEILSIGVKAIPEGKVSRFLNYGLKEGDELYISAPKGSFVIPDNCQSLVAVAAGSGITPILSMAKSLESSGKTLKLYYGNRTPEDCMFKDEIDQLANTQTTYFFTGTSIEGCRSGRINKESFNTEIKQHLDLLKADGFFLCGPEEMMKDVTETLLFYGVRKDKIHSEFFIAPVEVPKEKSEPQTYGGESHVKILLDDEISTFDMRSDEGTILEKAEKAGLDVPFSCRGGVCASCKAKVLSGKANMTLNYSLTDQEVLDGYILTCQAHPASEELTITFDE